MLTGETAVVAKHLKFAPQSLKPGHSLYKKKPKRQLRHESLSTQEILPPLPPLCEVPPKPPESLEEAMQVAREKDIMFYLQLRFPPSDLRYHPYDFMLV